MTVGGGGATIGGGSSGKYEESAQHEKNGTIRGRGRGRGGRVTRGADPRAHAPPRPPHSMRRRSRPAPPRSRAPDPRSAARDTRPRAGPLTKCTRSPSRLTITAGGVLLNSTVDGAFTRRAVHHSEEIRMENTPPDENGASSGVGPA